MDELKRILDDILSKSLDVRPEVQWLQKQHLLFMKKNGLTAKRDADTFLYEKMYAALPEQDSQITKIRFWRTGHRQEYAHAANRAAHRSARALRER